VRAHGCEPVTLVFGGQYSHQLADGRIETFLLLPTACPPVTGRAFGSKTVHWTVFLRCLTQLSYGRIETFLLLPTTGPPVTGRAFGSKTVHWTVFWCCLTQLSYGLGREL